MIELDEQALRERFAALPISDDGADWENVVRRAGRGGRARLAAVALAALVAIAVTTTALGLDETVIDWFTAEPAPPTTELAFSTLDQGAPPGMETGVLPGTARKAFDVALPEGDRATLWVAPTAKGGFCTMLQLFDSAGRTRGGAGPGCDNRPRRSGHGLTIPGPISPEGEVERGPVVLDGHVNDKHASDAIVSFEDGTEISLPLTWISSPIDAGFFVYGLPSANWHAGHMPARLRYVDAEGNTVSRQYNLPDFLRRIQTQPVRP
jgi:hypothetical protein